MPIEEYESVHAPEDNVSVTVVSRQCNAEGLGIFNSEDECSDGIFDEAGESEYRVNCNGTLALREGRLYLFYTEPANDGEEACRTEISFDAEEPRCITVTRSGEAATSFVLNEGSRSISVYKTPFGPIEMCVWTRKISNTMTEKGGKMSMDYTVELKGLTAQRTQITVTAEPIK